MKSAQRPQGPWYNAHLDEGIYDAEIVDLVKGKYGLKKDLYVQIVLWLTQPECHLVTNLYFATAKPDAKTVKRLSCLSQICGLVSQDAIDSPRSFEGKKLKVQIKKFNSNNHQYSDVGKFLHPDVIVTA